MTSECNKLGKGEYPPLPTCNAKLLNVKSGLQLGSENVSLHLSSGGAGSHLFIQLFVSETMQMREKLPWTVRTFSALSSHSLASFRADGPPTEPVASP